MQKLLQGTIRGRTIELADDPQIEEGRKVEVILRTRDLPGPPPGWRPGGTQTAAGMMADHWTEEDDRLLERIQQDRKRDRRPELEE